MPFNLRRSPKMFLAQDPMRKCTFDFAKFLFALHWVTPFYAKFQRDPASLDLVRYDICAEY